MFFLRVFQLQIFISANNKKIFRNFFCQKVCKIQNLLSQHEYFSFRYKKRLYATTDNGVARYIHSYQAPDYLKHYGWFYTVICLLCLIEDSDITQHFMGTRMCCVTVLRLVGKLNSYLHFLAKPCYSKHCAKLKWAGFDKQICNLFPVQNDTYMNVNRYDMSSACFRNQVYAFVEKIYFDYPNWM